jgi:hypothetical protein
MADQDPYWMRALKADPEAKESFLVWLHERREGIDAQILAAVYEESMTAAQRHLGAYTELQLIVEQFRAADREAVRKASR